MLDLLLENTTIIDGTGAPKRPGDVGVREGKIVAIGDVDESTSRSVDVEGRVVCPGFVDVHTHYDAQLFWDRTLSPSPFHGVTTVIGGNCGFSIAPLVPSAGPYLMSMLARVEGMPRESLEVGVPWDWESSADYFAHAEGGLAINAGFMVGHSALRRVVMGEAATERAATAAETHAMCGLLEAGLHAGGMGFSSTTSETHNDASGGPVPSRFADRSEFVALAAACGRHRGTSIEFLPLGAASPTQTVPEETAELMVALTVAGKRPVNWNVITASDATLDGWLAKPAISDRAHEQGGKIVALALPMDVQARFSFASGFSLDLLDGWGEIMAAPRAEKIASFRDPDRRRQLGELAARTTARAAIAQWATHTVTETFSPATKRFEGMTVAEIAEIHGVAPFDALVDVCLEDDLKTTFVRHVPPPTEADWNARIKLWNDPRVMIGASDAGAHLDMASSFRYATLFLAEAVRERGIFSLEAAVHKLTQEPAQLYGLEGRGVLEVGGHADLVVLDPDAVAPEPIRTTFDLPGGAGRLYTQALGIERVLVAGTEVVAEGEHTGALPGGFLRSGVDTSTPSLS